jgi:L-lactate dehydrogenase complex protein LldE
MSPTTTASRYYPPKLTDVYLFTTCLVDRFARPAGLDAVKLLEREGPRVR